VLLDLFLLGFWPEFIDTTFLSGAERVLQVLKREGETFWVQQFNMGDLRAAEPMLVEHHHLLLLATMHGSDYARGLDSGVFDHFWGLS
jgi:hypothetical protein